MTTLLVMIIIKNDQKNYAHFVVTAIITQIQKQPLRKK